MMCEVEKIDNKCENKDTINDKESYKSSKLILEYMYKEYTREIERRKGIETRIPILVTITIFFGGLILVNNTVNFTNMLKNQDKVIFIAIALQTISCICLLSSIILFLGLLISRPYKSINTDSFLNLKPHSNEEGLVAYDLIEAYKICTDDNKEINDKKHKINNLAVILLIISIISYVILRIISF